MWNDMVDEDIYSPLFCCLFIMEPGTGTGWRSMEAQDMMEVQSKIRRKRRRSGREGEREGEKGREGERRREGECEIDQFAEKVAR